MPAYFGPWRVLSDDPVSPQQLALARKLVGSMLEVGGIPSRRWDLPDGSTIDALLVNGIPKVTITQPKAPTAPMDTRFDLWAPRGFLLYPCYSNAPKGVGLPVVQQGTDPYAKANLDPGLDSARWTPGGPHGQVLLTKDADAGYPADGIAQPVPIAFGTQGLSVAEPSTYDSRKMGTTWLAFRPRYSDFVQHYANDPTEPRRATFAAVNAYRVKNNMPAAFLWPIGFYRPAEVLAYLLDANGPNQPAFPVGYQTTAERMTKDGDWGIVPGTYAEQATGGDPVQAFTGTTGIALTQGYYPAWPVFADVGFSNGQWALSIEDRSQWIAAGRKSFQSSDTGLPPISWDGYPSVNLGYATFPYFLNTANAAVYALTTPIVGTSYYASFMQSNVVQRQALGSRIYCRGRAIAELPNGGLVLGAGVIVNPAADRLIVIAHQPSDNVGLVPATQGYMRYAHVWYYDFPSGKSLRLHADVFVSSQWVDGGVFDVGGTKYDSFWAFEPDGGRAICLRDNATLHDLLLDAQYAGLTSPAPAGAVQRFYPYVMYYAGALKGAVVEMRTSGDASSLTTTVLPANITTADKPGVISALPHYVNWLIASSGISLPAMTPIAAEYVNGSVQVAYVAQAVLATPGGYDDVETSTDIIAHNQITFSYVGVGDMAAVYATDLPAVTLFSADNVTPECDFAAVRAPQLADLATRTFVVSGWFPRWTFDTALYDVATSYLEHFIPTANSPTCVLNTSAAVHRVRVIQNGGIVNESAYAHTSPYIWGYKDLADRVPTHPLPPPGPPGLAFADFTLSDVVQPFFASRFGETVFGYQVAANAVLRNYYDFGAKCSPDSVDYASAQNAGISVTPTTASFRPMGGWYKSSFSIPVNSADWYSEALVC